MKENKTSKTIIIAGSAGVGKTELAKRYSNVLDLECSDYYWIYDGETRKPSPAWPANYLWAIRENLDLYDYILIFTRLEKHGFEDLEYQFFFPSKEAIADFEDRLERRGETWARKVYADYDNHLETARSFGKPIVFLNPGETLEDYLLKHSDKYPELISKLM